MTIDLTIALYGGALLLLCTGGVSYIATKLANGGGYCKKHFKIETTLQNLENAHKEDTLHDVVKKAVKEVFEENGK